MTFETLMSARAAEEYADLVLPWIVPDDHVLDVGCGPGSISIGIAGTAQHVTAIDLEDDFQEARAYAESHGIVNVEFRQGTIYDLDLPDESFDVATCFSMLETLERPVEGLVEARRTIKAGGVIGVSSVEYGGLVLHGPDEPLLRRFYELRLALWKAEGVADPNRGRALRGLLQEAGYERIEATTRSFSYGTPERVRSFGYDRAADCRDEWYVDGLTRRGLATVEELQRLEQAWLRWAEAPDAFASFAWGRAIGRKPGG